LVIVLSQNSELTDKFYLSVFSYFTFTNIINISADSTIPKKRLNTNPYPPFPPWWNSDCSEAVKNRTLFFRIFHRSGSMIDFINYRNACAQTTRLLKNEKRKKWKKFCSNLNPSFPIHHLWSTAKRYKNCINPAQIMTIGSTHFVLKSLRAMSLLYQSVALPTTLYTFHLTFSLMFLLCQN